MSEPNYSIGFTARMLAASACAVGDVLIYNAPLGYWVVATAANRAALPGVRAQAIALTAYGGSAVGKVSYQAAGVVANEVSELGVGLASWVRVSSTGRAERCTPADGDDIIGKCGTDGRLHLQLGTWDAGNTAGGGAVTFGGDLSGDNTSQVVERVKGTTIETAGGALTVGWALRTTDGDDADWGPIDLGNTNATTNVLSRSKQQAQLLVGDATGNTGASVVEAITGASGIAVLRSTASNIQWVTAAVTPTINQAPNTALSGVGANLTVQAQNATGGTSTGGTLILSAGAGTSFNGSIRLAVNGSTGVQITPSNSAGSIYQVVAGATSVLFQQSSNATNGATAATMTVQAQNATGTTSTGGALNLTSGTGTSAAGALNLQTGGTVRLQLGATTGYVAFQPAGATIGLIRLKATGSIDVLAIDNGIGGNRPALINVNSSTTEFTVGIPDYNTKFDGASTVVNATTYCSLAVGGVDRIYASTSNVRLGLPVAGNAGQTVPFRLQSAAIVQSSTTATTLSAAQYECPILTFTGTPGGAFNVIAPNVADAWFIVFNGTPSTMTFKTSAGTGIAIGSFKTAQVRNAGTDYVRVTLDA